MLKNISVRAKLFVLLILPVAALIGTQLSRFTAKRVGPKPEPEKKPSQRSKRMRE